MNDSEKDNPTLTLANERHDHVVVRESNFEKKHSMMHNAMGSAMAGIISRCFTHPLDTAKARLQALVNNNNSSTTMIKNTKSSPFQYYRGPLDVLRNGTNLYRGFSTVVIGGTPGTVLYFCSYEYIKEICSSSSTITTTDVQQSSSSAVIHFGAGMLAEAIACVIYVPVDVLKERMQVNYSTSASSYYYRNALHGLQEIYKHEGIINGLYRGYGATLLSFGPFSALYFSFYEQFKEWSIQFVLQEKQLQIIQTTTTSPESLPFSFILLNSCMAGSLASWMTSPLDMAKLRLQIQRGSQQQQQYRNMRDVFRETYSNNGIKGLFRGAGARVLHFAPATTITMTCYESFRSYFAA